jgi:hypothetical protein
MTFSLVAAVLGAVLYGVASVLQALAVRKTAGLNALRQPLYLAGFACDGAAWVASLLALHALPLFTVQAVLAGSLAVAVVLARIFLAAVLRTIDIVGVVVVVGSLAVLSLAAGPDPAGGGDRVSSGFKAAMLASLVALAVAAVMTYRRGSGIWFAAIAGLASSGAAISARAAHLAMPSGALDVVRTLGQPLVWAIVGFGVLTAVTYARALERAAVGPATAVLSVVDVIVPAAIGLVVLHDVVRVGWAPAAVAATVAALGACVVLAMSPAEEQVQGVAAVVA